MTSEEVIRRHLSKLRKRAESSHHKLKSKFPHVVRKLEKLGLDIKDLRRHSARTLAAAALAGAMFTSSATLPKLIKPPAESRQVSEKQTEDKLRDELSVVLPKTARPLSPQVEEKIGDVIFKNLGVKASAALEGNHLNTSYGRIGGEQHLPRYPGDSVAQHDELQNKGITRGKGAWGYFVPNKAAMTQDDFMREKYYVAVQTLYLPNWKQDLKYLREWYKYRKVLVVNPSNGKSVVAVIADAGPAAWTTKHFGGSPEVMEHLAPYAQGNNGKVILFFVDDRDKQVALGPVEFKSTAFIARK